MGLRLLRYLIINKIHEMETFLSLGEILIILFIGFLFWSLRARFERLGIQPLLKKMEETKIELKQQLGEVLMTKYGEITKDLTEFKSDLNNNLGSTLISKYADIAKELEEIQRNLDVLKSSEIDLIREERNAIVEFNRSLSSWMNSLSNLEIQLNSHDFKSIEEDHVIEYNRVLEAISQIDLFTSDKELPLDSRNFVTLVGQKWFVPKQLWLLNMNDLTKQKENGEIPLQEYHNKVKMALDKIMNELFTVSSKTVTEQKNNLIDKMRAVIRRSSQELEN